MCRITAFFSDLAFILRFSNRHINHFTPVNRLVHRSATIQMQVGKYAYICSIYFQ